MPKGGHNKKPAALKLVHGDTTKKGAKKHAAKTKAELAVELPKTKNKPQAPEWFTEEQHKAFEELSLDVAAFGLLHGQDRGLLCTLADLWTLYKNASIEVQLNGTTYASTNRDGEKIPKKRPEFEVLLACVKELRFLFNEFGMSPLGRCRLSVDAKEVEANVFDGF